MLGLGAAHALSCVLLFAVTTTSFEQWTEQLLDYFNPPPTQNETSVCGDALTTLTLPKLLIARNHPNSENSGQARLELLEKGRRGELPVATNMAPDPFFPYEPAARGGTNGLLISVESPIPLALLLSYQSQDDLLWERKFVGDVFELTLFQIPSLPLYKNAFAQLGLTEKSERVRGLTRMIQVLQSLSGFNFVSHEGMRRILNRAYFILIHADTKREFIFSLHRTVIELANKHYLNQLGIESLPIYSQKEQHHLIYGPLAEGQKPIAELLKFEIRNRDLSRNILQLACTFKGSYEQMGVVIDAGNIDGVITNLQQVTRSQIQIEELR